MIRLILAASVIAVPAAAYEPLPPDPQLTLLHQDMQELIHRPSRGYQRRAADGEKFQAGAEALRQAALRRVGR